MSQNISFLVLMYENYIKQQRRFYFEKENFIINKKTGTVLYTAQTSFEARNIYNELPAKVNCVITGKTLSMNKNALEEYLDETLYIGWLEQRRLRYKK